MLNKATTSTGLLILGLSSFADASSTSIEDYGISAQGLYAVELEYNSPESVRTRVDNYVDYNYKMGDNLANKYSLIDYGFMSTVQNFAKNQVDLDEEFSAALDELFLSKVNSKPTKERF